MTILLLDFILVFVTVEAAFIVWRRTSRGQARALPGDLLNLGSGFCLMLAVRLAWTNTSALAVIALVTVAGVVHAVEITRRFRRSDAAQKKAPIFGAPVAASETEPPY
jgi:hypothetical protein